MSYQDFTKNWSQTPRKCSVPDPTHFFVTILNNHFVTICSWLVKTTLQKRFQTKKYLTWEQHLFRAQQRRWSLHRRVWHVDWEKSQRKVPVNNRKSMSFDLSILKAGAGYWPITGEPGRRLLGCHALARPGQWQPLLSLATLARVKSFTVFWIIRIQKSATPVRFYSTKADFTWIQLWRQIQTVHTLLSEVSTFSSNARRRQTLNLHLLHSFRRSKNNTKMPKCLQQLHSW